MREFKFRVITENGIFYVPSESFSLSIHSSGYEIVMWCSDGIVDSFPAISIEQYTGLKDKNGKEIYEGDIIENSTYGGCWAVQYGEQGRDYCGFIAKSKSLPRDDSIMFYREKSDHIIISGNIHENPDLLK